MIDSNLLEYLLIFLEEGSLSKAASRLSLSQPSLSKGMQKLEDELGIPLFERSANKLHLNENGETLLPYFKDIVTMERRLIDKAKEIKENANVLSIGFTAPGPLYKFSNLFVPNETYTKVTAQLGEEEDLLRGIMNNVYDLVFVNRPISSLRLLYKEVLTESLFVSLPSSHFLSHTKGGIHWKDIDGQSFLLYSHTGVWKKIVDRNLPKSRFLQSDDCKDLKELAEFSSIPSFLTNVTIKDNGTIGRINIPIVDEDETVHFYAVVKENNRDLLELLQ